MASFEQLVQIEGTEDVQKRAIAAQKRTTRKVRQPKGRGCDFCTLNKVKGINKIFGKVQGRKFFVWAQSPGSKENAKKIELIGPAGEFLWNEMEAAGITREMCTIQNVVRCFPADRIDNEYLRMRNPTKQEIHCCSIYNDEAIAKALELNKTRVHLVFGQVAAKALLGREYRKDRRAFWSEKLKGKVICLDHPAFFIRQGGQNAPTARLKEFRNLLRMAIKTADGPTSRFGFLEKQNYIGVTTRKGAIQAYRDIIKSTNNGHRTSADLEEGYIDSHGKPTQDGTGHLIPLVIGFCAKPGTSYVFPLAHPDAPIQNEKARKKIIKLVRRLVTNPKVGKVFHHGSYDTPATEKMTGWKVKGFQYDTEFGEYFKYSDRYAFGLDAIANARFPHFIGYKEIVVPDALTIAFREKHGTLVDGKWITKLDQTQMYSLARKMPGGMNYALIPWKKMVMYNGADNDLQKRIELTTKDSVVMPLMRVYRDASFVLARMEKDGPLFDYVHHKRLGTLYPVLASQLLKKIRLVVKKYRKVKVRKAYVKPVNLDWKKFNPGSYTQVTHALYNVMQLPILGDKASSDKETMSVLSQYHKFPKYVSEWRALSKIEGTYLDGFKRSADANRGKLRTKWWITGTRTGRLSSGGGKEKDKESTLVNLQNIHGDPLLQCMLISDMIWRDVYKYWKKKGPFKSDNDIPEWILDSYVILGFDHAQMELRVVAEKSGDKALIKIFSSGEDPHSLVGHELTGWAVELIKKDERVRRIVKNMQFGIVYGLNEDNLYDYMVAKGVYKPLGPNPTDKEIRKEKKNRAEVKKFYRRYFKRFAGVRRMIDKDRAFAEENGYVQTLFGFKRKLDTSEGGDNRGGFWGNIAINMPVQGTAHQLMLMGIVPLHRRPKKYKLLKHPQMEIHDAIYFRLKLRHMFKAAKLGQYMLEKESLKIVRNEFGLKWSVPLKAEPKAGYRFGVIVKLDKEKGITNMASYLNQWCLANQKLQKGLQKQLRDIQEVQ